MNTNTNNCHRPEDTPANNSNNSPMASTSFGPDIANSIKDLSNQMQLINDTIGASLSSSQASNSQCHNCTATLGELQSQVQEAMARVAKMNQTLGMLQTHANMVQQSLETLASSVGIAAPDPSKVGQQQSLSAEIQSQVMSNPNQNDLNHNNKNTTTTEDFLAEQRRQIEEKNAKIRNRGNSLQQNAIKRQQEQPSGEKSFKEMLEERKLLKNANKGQVASVISNAEEGTLSNNNQAQKFDTLEDLIKSCASYLTGSHVEYTTWLQEVLHVKTISDLAKIVEERPGILVAGDGSVGMWQKRKFCDAVIAAAAAASDAAPSS